jgi:hypothetical protein
MGKVTALPKKRTQVQGTARDIAKALDRVRWRRVLCAVFFTHRRAGFRAVVGEVSRAGFRPVPLIACRVCGKSWLGKEVK